MPESKLEFTLKNCASGGRTFTRTVSILEEPNILVAAMVAATVFNFFPYIEVVNHNNIIIVASFVNVMFR